MKANHELKKWAAPMNAMIAITALFLTITEINNAHADLISGLVANYKFENNARDASGNNNNGVIYNASFAPALTGKGLALSGIDTSRMQVPHSATLSPSTAITLSVWANISSYRTSYSAQIYKAGEAPSTSGFRDRVYSLWATSNRGVHFTSTPAGGSSQIICNSPGSLYSINTFVHFSGVIDTGARKMIIYVNGKNVAQCPYAASNIRSGNYPLRIGAPFTTLSDQSGIAGILDEVRIYRRALSTPEISELYRVSKPVSGQTAGFSAFSLSCKNLTTGRSIEIPRLTDYWNCEDSGLIIKPGDRVQVITNGLAH